METKTKSLRWLLPLLSALFLLSGLTACDSTEDSVEDPAKPKPEVPIADGDWQVVPATGGTITKDSISITFPSGTFSEEAKVAITEVKKGEIGGEYEASPFYQITLPCNASKPMTIKIRSAKNSEDISFVANSPGHCISTGKATTIETILETRFASGEYSTTIPAIDENDESENVYFTIGLGQMINYSALTRGRFDDVLREGKVGNVSYKIRFPWSTLREYKDDKETLNQVDLMSVKINEYVQQALKHIFDLKFQVTGDRNLRINFVKGDSWLWGGYEDDWIYQDWSVINLSIRKLFESSTTETDIKTTVIHELFHFVQSDYDPRCQITKGWPWTAGGDYLTMYEMGAVWIENLMNDGQLNSAFVNECLMPAVKYDKWGFTVVKGDDSEKFQDQGYRWAPLLYYLCSNEELKRDYGFNNESVLELHNQWKKFFYIKPFIQIMNDWTYFTHHYDFFSGFHIDDYYLELLTGKLVKGVDALSLYKADYTIKGGRGPDKEIKDSFKKLEFEGNNYPYGCSLKSMHFQGMKNVSMKDKKLVVKQERKDVHTYLLTTGKASDYKSFRWSSQVASGNDSIVISGSTLEGLRQSDGSFDQYFFIVTTREINSYKDSETMPWKVTVELQGEEKEDKFEPRTDITSVDIHWRVCTTGGNWGNDENNKYEIGSMLDLGRDNPIQVAKSGNSISVSGKKKGSSIGVFSCDISYSFNIKLTSKGYGEITDLMMTGSGETTIGKTTIYLYDISLSASNLQFGSMTDTAGTWGLTESEGLKISNFKMKYDSGGDSPTSVNYASDPTNNVWINIGFGN